MSCASSIMGRSQHEHSKKRTSKGGMKTINYNKYANKYKTTTYNTYTQN